MRENGEQFVKTVVSYLQRKLPNIHGPGPLKEEHLNKVNFHADSLATILVSELSWNLSLKPYNHSLSD